VTELASTLTPCEIANQAAQAIAVLNELTHGGGELSNPGDVRAIVGSLELIGQCLPQLYEQLARFLVVQHEDGQVTHEDGGDPDDQVTETIEALAAAGQAADMMTAALTEARAATQSLTQARHRGWAGRSNADLSECVRPGAPTRARLPERAYPSARSQSHQASTPLPVRALISMTSAAGLTLRRLPRNSSMSKPR